MRMWNVPTKTMCDKHLLGEHVEMHMFIGSILHAKNLSGYIRTGLVELHNIPARHSQLALEMRKRGMRHKSPLPDAEIMMAGKVNISANIRELNRRCLNCRLLLERS